VAGSFSPPDRVQLATLAASAASGALGLFPGAAGAADPVTVLGWQVLCAPAAGVACGAAGLGAWSILVPASFGLLLALTGALVHGLATPHWALCALGGLFAVGYAFGAHAKLPRRAVGWALFLGTLLAGAPQGFGLLAGGTELARSHPEAAACLLDLSPLVLVFDCAGRDWVHAQPEVYSRSGVEWFQRRAYPGNLAGPAVLVVGCALVFLAGRIPRAARG